MNGKMDDGEVELSDLNSDSSRNIEASLSADSFPDELLRNAQTCNHTHTCNPPGPEEAHTHTCYHTHTHIFLPGKDALHDQIDSETRPGRSSGNREAVRRYREKKKAHTAYLEEEVKKLRFVNQELIRKLQRQTFLETEITRLRGLLNDLKGTIDNELGAFPYQKKCRSTTIKDGTCRFQSTGDTNGPAM